MLNCSGCYLPVAADYYTIHSCGPLKKELVGYLCKECWKRALAGPKPKPAMSETKRPAVQACNNLMCQLAGMHTLSCPARALEPDRNCDYCGGTGEVPESSTRYMPCPKCSKRAIQNRGPQ